MLSPRLFPLRCGQTARSATPHSCWVLRTQANFDPRFSGGVDVNVPRARRIASLYPHHSRAARPRMHENCCVWWKPCVSAGRQRENGGVPPRIRGGDVDNVPRSRRNGALYRQQSGARLANVAQGGGCEGIWHVFVEVRHLGVRHLTRTVRPYRQDSWSAQLRTPGRISGCS